MELLLLLVILPAVQDQNHTREWIKNAIRAWCSAAAWLLDLRSYLFGDTEADRANAAAAAAAAAANNPREQAAEAPNVDQNDPAEQEQRDQGQDENQHQQQPQEEQQQQQQGEDGLGAAHQALLQHESPVGFQPYIKPKMFPLLVRLSHLQAGCVEFKGSMSFQIVSLIGLMLLSWLVVSLIMMLAPVWIGRQIISLCFDDNSRVYELYTSAIGLYTCLLAIRGTTLVTGWIQQGWAQLSNKMREWATIVSTSAIFWRTAD